MSLPIFFRRVVVWLTGLVAVTSTQAWDYAGHRMVNQLALASLPADFPAFVHDSANAERVAFLAGEPDRWRNVPDTTLRQSGGSWADHFCDLEQLTDAGLDSANVPSLRYDFILEFAAGRAAHLDKFPQIDPTKNADHTREYPGFAPWAITEYYGRLKSAFAYLKVFQELGTPEEIANAQADIIYTMGVMGHYVGDCSQPLHTTVHHNGWVGANPNGYTTWAGIHSWIDGGLIARAKIETAQLAPRIAPAQPIPLVAQPDGRDPLFVAVMNYLIAQQKLVEPLYQLEKAGKFSDEMEKNGKPHQDTSPVDPEGREFIASRLLAGGEMLGELWVTAWKQAGPDKYLRGQLLNRQAAAATAAK